MPSTNKSGIRIGLAWSAIGFAFYRAARCAGASCSLYRRLEMKVKVISRSTEDYTRERSQDLFKVHRNLDPVLHPFEKAREYVRALNATKLERVFAKPYVASLSGHRDGVYCMAKHLKNLSLLGSGSADGEVRVWSVGSKKTLWSAAAHQGFVRGVCFNSTDDSLISVGDDKTIKIWRLPSVFDSTAEAAGIKPAHVLLGPHPFSFSGVDHHYKNSIFATGGEKLCVWSEERNEPLLSFSWGADTIHSVKFNYTETNVVGSCGNDRGVVLYDLRMSSPLAKVILTLRTNALSWNPMEPFVFTTASDDHNCYTFDMRYMSAARTVFKDHVAAVLDLDYSPTGQEIVTGSYDHTVRIFRENEFKSREVYHTRRMQRIFCVKYSMDARFVLTASDDANIRVWKALAAEKLGTLAPREEASLQYGQKLKDKFGHMPEIKRIAKHRHLPKPLYGEIKKRRKKIGAEKEKEERIEENRPGSSKGKLPEKQKPIVSLQQ